MYTTRNFKTKKALREAVERGEVVGVYQPNDLLGRDFSQHTGMVTLEGPHYPQPHRWYAQAEMVDGRVVKVR